MWGVCKKSGKWGCFLVKKSGKWGRICKKVDLSSTHGALCTVSVFFYFTFYLFGEGVGTHPTHPPAYGPGLRPTSMCLYSVCLLLTQ